MRHLYFFILTINLCSCSENIEQSYKDFHEYNQIDLRRKSWFPNLIAEDCYNIKEIHNLDNNNSFGVFSYRNNFRVDSLLLDSNLNVKTSFDTLNKIFELITKPKRPGWFLDKSKIQSKDFYKNGSMYLIKDDEDKTLYFIRSTL